MLSSMLSSMLDSIADQHAGQHCWPAGQQCLSSVNEALEYKHEQKIKSEIIIHLIFFIICESRIYACDPFYFKDFM